MNKDFDLGLIMVATVRARRTHLYVPPSLRIYPFSCWPLCDYLHRFPSHHFDWVIRRAGLGSR